MFFVLVRRLSLALMWLCLLWATGCGEQSSKEECTDSRFMGADCTECADPKFAGADCTVCADPKFGGDDCTACADPKFGGDNCTACADPKFSEDDCTTCADSKFAGDDCVTCADSKFAGDDCATCADPKFKGEDCSECADARFAGSDCVECAIPGYGGEACDQPPIYVDNLSDGEIGSGAEDDPFRDLQDAMDAAPDGSILYLRPGTFEATPQPYADPGCGNCDDSTFADGAEATRGFLVQGKSLHLLGAGQDQTILNTGAGYGLLFDEAGESSVRSLKITGGVRDADGKATDAGIVVRFTALTVEDVAVVGNDNLYEGEPDPVVGIGGIFGREGSVLTIRNSIIENNSWDGITLYRGQPGEPDTAPKAEVIGCRIGCTTGCVNPRGRGAGIGVTWDAELTAIGNTVHNYWKGIGSFGTSKVYAYNNVVRHQIGWGVIASGESEMHAHNNVIAFNGTTGFATWNMGVTGSFVNNIIYGNGTSADEWVGKKTGVWFNADPFAFELSYNLAFDNADFDMCVGGYPDDPANPCVTLEFDGIDGNIAADPVFVSTTDFHLQASSPAVDAGDPEMEDRDGTRSDIGVFGGQDAPESLP